MRYEQQQNTSVLGVLCKSVVGEIIDICLRRGIAALDK